MAFRRSALVGALLATFATASTFPASAQAPKPAQPSKPGANKDAPKPPAKPEEKKDQKAPDAAAPAAEETKEEKEPEKEDKQAVYLSLDLGFTRPDVGGFSDTTGFDRTSANGFLAGLGIGYRREAFRVGARFRDLSTTEFSLWSIMAEIGYGLKARPLSPTFYLHVGYAFDNGIERGAFATKLPPGNINVLPPDVDLKGVIFGGEVVASYWVTKFLRVGPFLGFDFTALSRPQPPLPQSLFPIPEEIRNNALFGDSGAGFGYVLSVGIRVTGDVGF